MAIQRSGKPAKETGVKYEVLEECGVIGIRKGKNGDEEVRLRYMSWNDREARYDIRNWYKDEEGNERCGKGIGLSGEELISLGELISKLAEED